MNQICLKFHAQIYLFFKEGESSLFNGIFGSGSGPPKWSSIN